MRKFILPITILLIIGFVASLFTGLWEKPLPEMERVEIPGGRVSLLLPKGAAVVSTPENPVKCTSDDYCFIQVSQVGQASEDFPETEIYMTQKNAVVQPEATRIRPDLVVFSNPKRPASVLALLKHPDGDVISIDIQFHDDIKKDADFCKRMLDIVIPSIQPKPGVRNLRERTETLDLPEAGFSLQIAVPQGFPSVETYRAGGYDDDGNTVCHRQGMKIEWIRSITGGNNTFFMEVVISKGAPGEDTLSSDITKREGVLLGQKMEWSISRQCNYRVIIQGIVPCGTQGSHLVVKCHCPEVDLPMFFSLVKQIKITETQP